MHGDFVCVRADQCNRWHFPQGASTDLIRGCIEVRILLLAGVWEATVRQINSPVHFHLGLYHTAL